MMKSNSSSVRPLCLANTWSNLLMVDLLGDTYAMAKCLGPSIGV